jgi:hypothetical protein
MTIRTREAEEPPLAKATLLIRFFRYIQKKFAHIGTAGSTTKISIKCVVQNERPDLWHIFLFTVTKTTASEITALCR